MKSFRSIQAKYSKRIHNAINNVGGKKWTAIRDTVIELVAGVAAVVELVGDLLKHVTDIRAAASGFTDGFSAAA